MAMNDTVKLVRYAVMACLAGLAVLLFKVNLFMGRFFSYIDRLIDFMSCTLVGNILTGVLLGIGMFWSFYLCTVNGNWW